MKKFIIVFLMGIILTGVNTFGQKFNYGSTMGLSGHHNFKTSTWNPTGEVCIVCHAPHGKGYTVEPNSVLWNHDLPATSFALYTSASFDGVSSQGQPDGNSKLCLSCHDGITIESNFNAITTGTNKFGSTSRLNVGSEVYLGASAGLGNDHPISFTYDASLASIDHNIYDPTLTASNLLGSTGTITSDLLFDGKLQCCSCHDPHNNTSGVLRKSNSGSALCITCHK